MKLQVMKFFCDHQDENGEGLTDLEIREEVDGFLEAGYDTTAAGITLAMNCYPFYTFITAIGWTLYNLALHKEHQEECRKEIREVLTGRDTDDITWWDIYYYQLLVDLFTVREDVSELSYITMCIKESMRLYPIVPYISKLLSEDLVVNEQKFPKGINKK